MVWFVLERTFSSPGLKAGSTFSWEQPLPTCASPASFEMQPLLGWAAVITLKHIVLPPLLAGRKEEYCTPSPDKIEINNWDFSQRADLSSLPLNPSWMGALYPFCFPGVSVAFCSSQPAFMGRFKAANSSQEFFLALCFPSAVCLPLHTTDADGSPSVVSNGTRCTSVVLGKCVCVLRNVLQRATACVTQLQEWQCLVLVAPHQWAHTGTVAGSPASIYWCLFTPLLQNTWLQITALGPPEFPHSTIHWWCPFISPGDDFFPWKLGFLSLSWHAEHLEVNLMESFEGESWFCSAVLQKHSQVLVCFLLEYLNICLFFSCVVLILARGRKNLFVQVNR